MAQDQAPCLDKKEQGPERAAPHPGELWAWICREGARERQFTYFTEQSGARACLKPSKGHSWCQRWLLGLKCHI